jgi:polar amino acid transport system permease protein
MVRRGPNSAGEAVSLSSLGKRRVTRGLQYAILIAAFLLIALRADWSAIARSFFNREIARQGLPQLFTIALRNTVIYTAAGYALGLAAGLTLALMRLSSVAPYRWISAAYVEVFRGLPAVVIFLTIFSLPVGFPEFRLPGGVYGQACLGLGLVSAAYMAETFRAGLQAVPKGQMEAARSLGMTYGLAMLTIVIPQAFRIVIPPLTNELVLLFKDSSLVLFLGVTSKEVELAKFGNDQASTFANTTPILVAGITYLLITIPLGYVARRLEARRKSR